MFHIFLPCNVLFVCYKVLQQETKQDMKQKNHEKTAPISSSRTRIWNGDELHDSSRVQIKQNVTIRLIKHTLECG